MKSDKQELNLDHYRLIVQEAEELDNLSWNITGGEPLMVDWLDKLIPILKPQRHHISVQTNGLLLSQERAYELAELGVNCITTSIDSIDPEEHNSFRCGNNAYELTLEGIANARKAGMQVLIGGVVTHSNLRSPKLRQLIARSNELGAIFMFNLAVPCGEWKSNNNVILRGNDREYLKFLMELYPQSTTDHEVGRNAMGCPAGKEKVYISPYGDVLPCPFIHVSFGNVKEHPLVEIVERMRKISYFNQYSNVCLAAEDSRFKQDIMDKVYECKVPIPVPYTKIFRSE